MLGYIHTSYGKRLLSEVQSEIEKFHRGYGVSGIFYDEVSNDDANLPYYLQCKAAERRMGISHARQSAEPLEYAPRGGLLDWEACRAGQLIRVGRGGV